MEVHCDLHAHSAFAGGARAGGGSSAEQSKKVRKRFEEFTEAVTTTILGLHRDQTDLTRRVDELEESLKTQPQPRRISGNAIWAVGASTVAIAVSIVALVLVVI